MFLWRAVDSEGEVLDLLVQRRRDKSAALRLLRKLMKRQGFAPRTIVTDRLRSMERRFASLASPDSITKVCEPTIARKTHTCRSGGESGKCSA
jgi:transposase-like protein